MRSLGFVLAYMLCVVVPACGDDDAPADPDTGPVDTGPRDTGPGDLGPSDAGPPRDAGPPPALPTTATATIGAAGGTITLDELELTIPPDALAADTTITVTHTDDVPAGDSFLTSLYVLEPDGLEFAAPVTARFTVDGAPVDAEINWAEGLDPTLLVGVSTTVEGNEVSATNTHFSSVIPSPRSVCGMAGCRLTLTGASIGPTSSTVELGGTRQLEAHGILESSFLLPLTSAAAWRSDMAAVADVDATGLVSGIARGRTTITATLPGGMMASTRLTVLGPFHRPAGFDGPVLALDVDEETGDVYAGGDFLTYESSTTVGRCIRLNDDGTPDTDFAVAVGFDSTVHAIAVAADGSGDVFVGGNFGTYQGRQASGLLRLRADGSPNASFAMGMGMGVVGRVRALAADTMGGVFAGGAITAYDGTPVGRIMRVLPDGTIDAMFAGGSETGFDGDVLAIAFAPDGSGDIYVGGDFRTYGTTPATRIARLDPSGALVATFDAGMGFEGSVLALAVADDGTNDIYVGGAFTTYDGTPVSRGIVRLHEDGTRDAEFDAGSGVDTSVNTIAVPRDGSSDVSIGGLFATYDGESHPNIVRVARDGSVVPAFEAGVGFGGGAGDSNASAQVAPDTSGDVYVGGAFRTFAGTAVDFIVRLTPSATSR